MVNLIAEFIYYRSQKLRKRVCNCTQWKVFNAIHIWKELKWLDLNAFHDLESNIDLPFINGVKVVLFALLTREANEMERIAGLIMDEYLALFPVDQFNSLSGKHPP